MAPAPQAWPASHRWFDLQTLAALGAPRRRLTVDLSEGDVAEDVLDGIAAHLGPQPHAEAVETADGTPHQLTVDLPRLTLTQWLPLSRHLSLHHPRHHLAPTRREPWHHAVATGRVVPEDLGDAGPLARRWVDRREGHVLTDEVRPLVPTHPEALALARDAAFHLGLPPEPDDPPRLVIRRRDGRVGLRVLLPGHTVRDAPAVVPRLTALIDARLGHHAIRLTPHGTWDDRLGLELTVWLLVAHAPSWPTGTWRSAGAPVPPPPLVQAVRLSLDGSPEGLWGPEPLRRGDGLTPDRADSPCRARPVGSPTWWAPRVGDVQAGPGLTARWRPALPLGLDDRAEALVDHPHRGAHRWWIRWRDVVADRDLLERTEPRSPDAVDRSVSPVLTEALAAVDAEPAPGVGDRWLRPIRDTQGRPGLALLLDAEHHGPEVRYTTALDALDQALSEDPHHEDLATVALSGRRLTVHLWRRGHPARDTPRSWTTADQARRDEART